MKQLQFSDFDAFASSVRDIDCKMTAHNSRFHRWSLRTAKAGDIKIQYGQVGSGNILEGQSKSQGYLLYLPLSPATHCAANGETIEKCSFLAIEPGGHFALCSSGAHDWLSVTVPAPSFGRGSHRNHTAFTTLPDPPLAAGLKQTVFDVLAASSRTANFAKTAAGLRAERVLKSACRQVIANRRIRAHARPLGFDHGDLIDKFRAHVDATGYTNLRVSKIARTLGISERTLRAVVRDYFTISPKRYIEATAMRNIRHELLCADSDENSVSAIFADYGIFEFGRFAGRYHQIYGEYPAETLQRSSLVP